MTFGFIYPESLWYVSRTSYARQAGAAIIGIRLHALDDDPPIAVEAAIVRSSLGSRVELEFLRVAPKEKERLNEFILSLWIEGTQMARSSGRWKTSPLPGP